jgi:hypothetical protein
MNLGVYTGQVVVTAGVAIASYGEINFVVIGVIMQLLSVTTESTRLTLVQILLQVPPHLTESMKPPPKRPVNIVCTFLCVESLPILYTRKAFSLEYHFLTGPWRVGDDFL